MIGRGKLQIEHEYQHMLGNYVPLDEPVGAIVARGDLACQLSPEKGRTGLSTRVPSEFPEGSVLAVRRADLEDFIRRHLSILPARAGELEKPLGERERSTLLTIVAALAKAVGIDVGTPSKAGQAIEALTTEIGARVSGRTVEEHLKRIPDALERRGKDSN